MKTNKTKRAMQKIVKKHISDLDGEIQIAQAGIVNLEGQKKELQDMCKSLGHEFAGPKTAEMGPGSVCQCIHCGSIV